MDIQSFVLRLPSDVSRSDGTVAKADPSPNYVADDQKKNPTFK
jgi:hypothetical protein